MEEEQKVIEHSQCEPAYKCKAHPSGKSCLAFSLDGKKIVTSGVDGIVKIWSVRHILTRTKQEEMDRLQPKREKMNSKAFKELRLDQGHISCVTFNRSAEMIAAGSIQHNSIFIIVRKPTLHVIRTLNGHTRPVISCKFVVVDDSQTNRLVSSSFDKTIRDWDVETGKITKKFECFTVPISIDLSLVLFVSGHQSGDVRLWSLSAKKELKSASKLHSSPVTDVKFTKDGLRIVTASSDDQIKIVDMKTMTLNSTIHVLD